MSMTDRENVGTIEDLHASATKITGLTDFGKPDYLDGLSALLESYERDAQLTSLGRKVARSWLARSARWGLLSIPSPQRSVSSGPSSSLGYRVQARQRCIACSPPIPPTRGSRCG